MHRTKITLLWVLSFLLFSLKGSHPTSSHLAVDTFEPAPAVWRTVKKTSYLSTHSDLRQKFVGLPDNKHNRLYAVLSVETTSNIILIPGFDHIFKSNHLYTLDENQKEYDKEAIEGQCSSARRDFSTSATQLASETDPNKAVTYLSLHKEKTTALDKAFHDLIPLRALESEYKTFYPFKATIYLSRMLDSESSLCRLVESKVNDINTIPEKKLIRLHMHSDKNSCFYCVQLLHHFGKMWAQQTKTPWLIMVNNHEDYTWKGVLPSGVDDLNKKSMRSYCKDDRFDRELTQEEIQEYCYSPIKPGKIIQIFMPGLPPATAVATNESTSATEAAKPQ